MGPELKSIEDIKSIRLKSRYADEKIRIAIISHDSKKPDMVAFVMKNIDLFKSSDIHIVATGTTGKHIEESGLDVECVNSGPFGGDAQIASMLVEGKIDCVIFLIDPMYSHPHEVDIHMLLRLCNVYDIPLATNLSTAKILIQSIKNAIF